jgi:exodeoxyribonuclease VII large subunit
MSNNLLDERIFKVSELNNQIKLYLEPEFARIQVLGESSGVTLSSAGHLYFTLKDETAAIRVVMFRGSLIKSTLRKLENGQQIVVKGSLSMYPPRGEIQIVAQDIQQKGKGDIFAALEKLKKLYQDKGYFDPAVKKKLPLLPKRIGVVTSPTGAAFRDIIRILHRRFPGIELVLYPAKVQGEGAAVEIADGIDYFNRSDAKPIDVLIVGRGGGSYEDLWAFNEEPVVEAIHRSRIPVISAVGHEVDFTIADFTADVRAATPSAAAELVVGKKDEFLNRIDHLRNLLLRRTENLFHRKRESLASQIIESSLARYHSRILEKIQTVDVRELHLNQNAQHLVRRKSGDFAVWLERLAAFDCAQWLQNRQLRLGHLQFQLSSRTADWFKARREKTEFFLSQLQALNPDRILGKGYSITTRSDGRTVRDADVLNVGEELRIRFARGRAGATVTSKE